MKKRSVNIDLVKCIAVFSVISVHFFLNTNFYDIKVTGNYMYLLTSARTLFMVCVPLFMITTGYLMRNKELSLKYYKKIKRVILLYIIINTLIVLYNHFYLGEAFRLRTLLGDILGFRLGYSWYVNMYIGLYLLIPFLNIIYNNLDSKKKKIVLIVTLLFLTSFPGIINIKRAILPTWWTGIYPITYYFIGCYLNEYKLKINKRINIILFIITLIISSGINIYISKGTTFVWGIHNDWGSILNVMTSVLLFNFIISLNLNKINNKVKRIIIKVSELSFGIYLSSYISDNLLYNHFYDKYLILNIPGYFKVVPLSFILATSISMIANFIYNLVNKLLEK